MGSVGRAQNGDEFSASHLDTVVVRGGHEPDAVTGAVTPSISLSTTFTYNGLEMREHMYSRISNPCRLSFEKAIATAENAAYGLAFSSGMAAISAVVRTLPYGAHVVRTEDMYGGTTECLEKIGEDMSFQYSSFTTDADLEQAIIPGKTKFVWLEAMSNPTLKIVDIEKVCVVARKYNAIVVVDNTFLSPMGLKPLQLGAHIVLHSVTKYINGHSDVVMGVVAMNDGSLYKRLHSVQTREGAVPSPFDCFLASRGLRTLALRMQRHEENARAMAEMLESHNMVSRVLYPGLKSHPQHEIAKKQLQCYSGMITFYIKGGLKAAAAFLKSLKLIVVAVSLGSVETLIEHPALMTHKMLSAELRAKLGISDELLRLSVGIEHVDDLVADVRNALEVAACECKFKAVTGDSTISPTVSTVDVEHLDENIVRKKRARTNGH